MDRRRFAIGSLALALLALAALPALASARIAYFTGGTGGSNAYAASVDLSTGVVRPEKTSFSDSEGGPSDVAITPDGRTAYVTNFGFGSGGSEVVPIDVATEKAGAAIPVDSFPTAIAIAPDGRFAYVVSYALSHEVSKIDLTTNTVMAKIPLGGDSDGIAITPDGRTAYVTQFSTNTVLPIDLATDTVGTPIPVGSQPSAIAVTPDGTAAYVLNSGNQTLSRIDVASNTVTATIAGVTGSEELAITPNGAKAYGLNPGNLTPVDLASGTAGNTKSPSGQARDLAILPDGSRAYLTISDGNALIPVPVATDEEELPLPVGSKPNAIAIVPNQPPRAAFGSSPSSPMPGSSVSFDATGSTDSDGSVVRYDWEFGDGTSAANAGPKPTHAYAKAGTYQVTLAETDNEGCSTKLVFTGQTAYCNGSAVARVTHSVTVASASPSPTPEKCVFISTKSSSFVPKRRPGHVVPGVRVRLATNAPAQVSAKVTLLRQKEGKPANVVLGKLSVFIKHWRRVRFVLPVALRQELPLGTPVRVQVWTQGTPKKGSICPVPRVKRRPKILDLHVVKVFPDRVQFKRSR